MNYPRLRHFGIEQLIEALDQFAKTWYVQFDNGYYPTGLSSYRGYYEDLAIKWDDYADAPAPCMTVSDLQQELSLSIGKEFEGYKGGQFEMHANTKVWASPYGEAEGLGIVQVLQDVDTRRVILRTCQMDPYND